MKIRTRISLVLAACLILFGSFTLLINELAFRNANIPSASAYQADLLRSIGVDRNTVLQQIRAHPELLFTPTNDQTRTPSGLSVDAASREIQRRTIQHAVTQSRRWTLLALIGLAIGALSIGWLLAGRILRPVRLLTKRAQAAADLDLRSRVSLEGPNDEMKELADTFDGMLDRIAISFEAQRRFSSQVSHELRTPLSVTRSEAELMLADCGDSERRHLAVIVDATNRAERLVTQLLVLSRTDTLDLDWSTFELDELVGNVVGRAVERPSWSGVRVDLELSSTTAAGDRALVESLVNNLVDNAARHNVAQGWARISVRPSENGERAVLVVSNSSAPATQDMDIENASDDLHIGLTIVEAVVQAHKGQIAWSRDDDVVTVRVELPRVRVPESAGSPVNADARLVLH
jgi:signal transduction histidine kinase